MGTASIPLLAELFAFAISAPIKIYLLRSRLPDLLDQGDEAHIFQPPPDPRCHHSITPSLHCSIAPSLHCSPPLPHLTNNKSGPSVSLLAKGVSRDMKLNAKQLRLLDARSYKSGFLAATLGVFTFAAEYRQREPTYIFWLGVRAVNAVKGTWLDDHTFQMNRQLWTFRFDGDVLNLDITLIDGREISMDGKTGG